MASMIIDLEIESISCRCKVLVSTFYHKSLEWPLFQILEKCMFVVACNTFCTLIRGLHEDLTI